MLTEKDAELIAKYVVKFMRTDLLKVALNTKKVVTEEVCEDVLDSHQAAKLLGVSYDTLKKNKHKFPYHQEVRNGKIHYLRSELLEYIRNK